jgi:hypothetical protein
MPMASLRSIKPDIIEEAKISSYLILNKDKILTPPVFLLSNRSSL